MTSLLCSKPAWPKLSFHPTGPLLSFFSTTAASKEQNSKSHIRGQVNFPVAPGFQDLSLQNKPIGNLFGSLPTSASNYAKFSLTAAQKEFYRVNGYLSNVKALSEEDCDRLIEEFKQFTNPERLHPGMGLFHEFHWNQSGDVNNVLMHALGHWRISSLFHDLIWHPAIAFPSAQLLHVGQRLEQPVQDARKEDVVGVRFWHDQLFAKPSHHGGSVAWHQDYSYWTRSRPMQHMTVHLALDTQTMENGTLHFVPGSHRWRSEVMPITSDDFSTMDSVLDILTKEERVKFKPAPALLKKGEISFHHPLTLHGSYANRSSLPRRAAVINYFADGTYSDTDEEMLRGVPIIAKGQKMQGQFFPLVFDPRILNR